MTHLLIGIDDTDNLESRGTGYRARQLGQLIQDTGLGRIISISRHQLFFDRRIPYTSHNSSACLFVVSDRKTELIALSRDFLLREAAVGSDAGLAVQYYDKVNDQVVLWGNRAKKEVLSLDEAKTLAADSGIYLEGLTGTHDGIIGSLAALGLRKGGNDGRCVWVNGKEIREIKGIYEVSGLFAISGIDGLTAIDGGEVLLSDRIDTGGWIRPAVKNHRHIVFVEKSKNTTDYEWTIASKEYIKHATD
ncbi:MAG: hypothetical protein KGZ82_11115 [Bacteroidales bacterium]|nr:hypothetical protein [Bacteroidales bacterium]